MKQRFGVSVLVVLLLSVVSRSQAPTAVVNGQVRDASGAAIAGATVEVFNDATHVRYATETNGEGIYSVPGLPPGAYHIQVSKQGFKTVVHPDITLNVQDAKAIGFTLPVGAISETVTVEGGVTMVNTENAAVSTVVDETYIKNMPLNGRSFQDLILLTPGVVTNSATPAPGNVQAGLGRTGEFSVNGQRTESNYYTVDGVSANVGVPTGTVLGAGLSGSLGGSTALGTTQALVSVDALQEFRVQSSTYSAEYGRNPGGQFAFETKSGANQWHGTVYDYLRNDLFDATDWFNDYFGLKKTPLRQNDFGGTLGGPLGIPRLYNGKNKTFFFVSYEGLRLTAPQPVCVTCFVPDPCMRGSASACSNLNAQYAGTPAGNAIGYPSSGRSPAAPALLPVVNAFPLPSPQGLEDPTNGVGQFIGAWSNPASLDSTSVRFDHVVNDKLRLFFRFSDTNSETHAHAPAGDTPTEVGATAYTMRTYTAGASSTLTNRITNEFRLNYTSNESEGRNRIDKFGGSTPADLVQLSGLQPGGTAALLFFLGPYFSQILQQDIAGTQRQWNVTEAAGLSFGRHQFKFGVDYRRLAPFAVPTSPIAIYLYGLVGGEGDIEANNGFIIAGADSPAYPLYKNFSAFAQDEWKVSQRLSLSLGLRWEVNPPPGVTQGLMPYTVQGSGPDTWTLAPQGTPLWHTTWYNFAPRLGAAYILHNAPGRETVVRGGGGVFFDTGQQLGSISFLGPGFSSNSGLLFTSFPGNPGSLIPPIANPPQLPLPSGTSVGAFASHLQVPYTLQWNASIEQALGKSQALTLSYVGSHAGRLLQQNNFSSSTNSTASEFFVVQNGLSADYDSLQAQFRRRLSQGITALTSYTWSHCIDFGSENYFWAYQRGNCDFDVRHNFSAAFSYDLPNVGRTAFLKAVIQHWGFDDRFTARTGFPVTLDGQTIVEPNGQQFHAGLNLVAGQPVYLYGTNCASQFNVTNSAGQLLGCPGGRAINPKAFAPAVDQNGNPIAGNAPRNLVRGFGAWQMDLAVRREFPIYERLKLQFRAEAFNVLNHPNFGSVNPNFGQQTFGQATSTLANSLGILNPLYQMGGPRSMQFALKLTF